MTIHDELRALIDPAHTELIINGVLQHVTLTMSSPPPIDEHSPPWAEPATVTLRPEQARDLAEQLLTLADQAQAMRGRAVAA
ncbi:MAG: hypothetical protein M3459_12400 [Actinomycetota bacterium]|nr:hypothetical protein [Actinomycetota bacterium]